MKICCSEEKHFPIQRFLDKLESVPQRLTWDISNHTSAEMIFWMPHHWKEGEKIETRYLSDSTKSILIDCGQKMGNLEGWRPTFCGPVLFLLIVEFQLKIRLIRKENGKFYSCSTKSYRKCWKIFNQDGKFCISLFHSI